MHADFGPLLGNAGLLGFAEMFVGRGGLTEWQAPERPSAVDSRGVPPPALQSSHRHHVTRLRVGRRPVTPIGDLPACPAAIFQLSARKDGLA